MKTSKIIFPDIIADKLTAIHDICLRHHIKHLWVFGSVLRDDFRDDSDIDFLFEWDRPAIKDDEYLQNLDGFIFSLRDLFKRKIDLVYYPALKNPYFIREIEKHKALLYAQRAKEISI